MPRVSVLVPVYRPKAEFLRAAIDSILKQTFKDFELILLDDCPEDRREDVVRSYSDPRIVYVQNPRNLGITASRNKLIDLAKGDYLAIFDHDDVSRPMRLQLEAEYLDAHPEVGCVSGLMHNSDNSEFAAIPSDDAEIRYRLLDQYCFYHTAAMVRKSVLTENGIRYEAYYSPAEDYALWCRLASVTKFHNLQEVLVDYRIHESNTSDLQRERMELGDLRVKAFYKAANPELWNEMLSRSTLESDIRVLGLHILKIVETPERREVRLFGIPIVKTRRWRILDDV